MRVRILSASDEMQDITLAMALSPDEMRVTFTFGALEAEGVPGMLANTAEAVFRLDELRKRRDWKAGSTFSLVFDRLAGAYVGIMNDTAESLSSRRDPSAMVRAMPREYVTPIRLILPFERADFSEMGILVFQNTQAGFECNEDFASVESESIALRRQMVRDFLPQLRLSGPGKIGTAELAEFTVTATRFGMPMEEPLEVHVAATAGYLPKNRIVLSHSQGSFTFRALDLQPLDTAELKVGLRYLASMDTKTVGII